MATNIYFNRNLVTNGWIPFLVPILGIEGYSKGGSFSHVDKQQLQDRKKVGKNMIGYSDIQDCDFCVFPIGYKIDFFDQLLKEAKLAEEYHKNIIVFYEADNELPIPYIKNVIVYRTSLRNDSPVYEYALPTFSPSIYDENKRNNSHLNDKGIIIGYTGYSGYSGISIQSKLMSILEYVKNWKICKKIVSYLVYHTKITNLISDKLCKNPEVKKETLVHLLLQSGKGKIFRGKCIDILKGSKYKFNFIERKGVLNPSLAGKMRNEYIDSIYNSTFTLVVRGYGNYAHRLFETASAGKIPLFVDTNCRLPFESEINYKKLFLIVPYKDFQNVDIYIDNYLKNNTGNLKRIEKEIRGVYDDYFTMQSFFPKIINFVLKY